MRKPILGVTLINLSEGVLHDSECLRVHGALQTQVQRDFSPAWGVEVRLGYLRPGTRTPADPKTAWLVVLKDHEQAKTLGIEDLTPAGLPLGKVFSQEIQDQGKSVSAALSRELLSMLVDSSLTGLEHDPETGLLHAREVCAPVSSDALAYRVNGLLVSDFVTPAYYQRGSAGPHDYRRALKGPFEIAPDGELVALEIGPETGWKGSPPTPGSRIERRRHAHENELIKSAGSSSSFTAPLVAPRPVMPTPERAGPPVVRPGVPQPVLTQKILPPLRAQHPDGAPPLAIDHRKPPEPVRAKTKEVIPVIPTTRVPHPAPLRMSTREEPKQETQAVEPRKAFPAPVRAGSAKKVPVLQDTPSDTPSSPPSSPPSGESPKA